MFTYVFHLKHNEKEIKLKYPSFFRNILQMRYLIDNEFYGIVSALHRHVVLNFKFHVLFSVQIFQNNKNHELPKNCYIT